MKKNAFLVEGGRRLKGEIVPQGAKNEALQVMCAVLLTEETVTIHNLPDIRDVKKLLFLLKGLGVEIEKISEGSYRFTAKDIDPGYLASDEFRREAQTIRGSVMILGPLLARFGEAKVPRPGGDKIGRRRLDTHFLGFEKLGATFSYNPKDNFYYIDAGQLIGTYILLDEPSVTGTANVIMAAVKAKGVTTLYNAACEPYIQQLCKMLVQMGADIDGAGSNLIKIRGSEKPLGGTTHRLLPDMIEIGSFIGLAAMTQSEIRIKDTQIDRLGLIPSVFRRLGITINFEGDDICIPAQEKYAIERFIDGSILNIADGPWPLFTPDLLSIVLVVATQAKGTVLIHQKMFESRLFFVDKLIEMGAQIILCDPHRATVIGLNRQVALRGINMTSPDIRAGVALLIAALSAEGNSTIYNIEQIDRGYQHIDRRLQNLGAGITRL